MNMVFDILAHIDTLKPLSPSAARLAAVVADPDSSVDQVAEIVKYDQALTAQTLKYANSAMSGATRRIETVKDAVVRLGGARILRQILSAHISTDFSEPVRCYGYTENDLWRHSVAAAVASEVICKHIAQPPSGIAFTTALLHDIGKLILGRVVAEELMQQVWAHVSTGISCNEAEMKVLGISHATVGAQVLSAWGLLESMQIVVRDHHFVSGPSDRLLDVVAMSNLIARFIGEGIGHEGMSLHIDQGIGDRLGLGREMFEKMCAETAEMFSTVLVQFG